MRPACSIRVFVRNKSRYNPETTERNFLYVDVNDFAGTTIGEVKENVKRQSGGAARIDELFLNNQSLADDRSVAHYNLEDGCILETTSNPLWVSCLYIKASEIKQEMEGNPNDANIQKWTQKSLPKKYVLIGVLLNSKNEYGKQPPHFPTLDDFAVYMEGLKKKAATMHPEHTQKDMRAFEREYRQEFVGRYDDPIAAFIDHHAVRLGLALPDEIEQRPLVRQVIRDRNIEQRGNNATTKQRGGGRKKQEKYCDDCEEALAEVYCGECQGGLAMCRLCSNVLHAGASRRRHNLQDINQAPSSASKPYIPRAFLAPFSIVLAMFSALSRDSILSLTEEEIKKRAQPLTDTDLQDKQAGKYVGGFDCMENVLMNKGLVKKEAARVPTYALSASGQVLGQKLYTFYNQFYTFMESCRLPKIQNSDSGSFRTGVINNRKLCLIIDENERDKQRLLRYAKEKNIDAQVRLLPAGDYIWVLTPPMIDTSVVYTGKDYGNEMVLSFVVERKSWEDFENTTNSTRFKRQINNMLGSGLTHCFYLMEGSSYGMKSNSTHHRQQYLKGLLEKLMTENGFYINYTSSWMKSAQWLLWFTGFLSDACKTGLYQDECVSYQEYMSRVGRQRGSTATNTAFTTASRYTHTWKASLFVDHIIRDSQRERTMLTTVREDLLGVSSRNSKHLLVLQDLEQYNKRRQTALNKCCEAVYANPDQARDIVEEKLGPVVHNMLHYDIASYWQLYMQVMTGVYVVRTETAQDTEKMCRIFTSAPRITPSTTADTDIPVPRVRNRGTSTPKKPKRTATITSSDSQDHISNGLHDNEISRVRHLSAPHFGVQDKFDDNVTPTVLRKTDIHSLYSEMNRLSLPVYSCEGNVDKSTPVVGHFIKRGKHKSNKDRNGESSPRQVKIQPFSGQGHCLGTGSSENHKQFGLTGDRSKNNVQSAAVNTSVITGRPGLVGGMWNSQHNSVGGGRNSLLNGFKAVINDEENSYHHTDFVDSQNEDEVLKEILAKSAAEASLVTSEAYSLPRHTELGIHEMVSAASLPEEEQLKHVLEISKSQTGSFKNTNKIQSSVNIDEDFDNLTEDEMLKHAIEMSMVDADNDLQGFAEKLLPSDDQKDVIVIQDTEDDKENTVSKMSCKRTPKKRKNESEIDGQEKITFNRTPCKRNRDNSPQSCVDLIEEMCEEDQLKVAIDLSMSQIIEENRCSENETDTRDNISGPIERSKVGSGASLRVGVSPCKKYKFERDNVVPGDNIKRSNLQDVVEIIDIPFKKENETLRNATKRNTDKKVNVSEQGQINESTSGQCTVTKNGLNPVAENVNNIANIEVIEIDSQNSQGDENEKVEVDLVSSFNSDSELEKNASKNLMSIENEGSCGDIKLIAGSTSMSDPGEDESLNSCDTGSSVKDNSDNAVCEETVSTEMSNLHEDGNLVSCDTQSSLKDDNDDVVYKEIAGIERSKDIEDSDFIPPSPERNSLLSNSSLSQSFFSKTPENVGHRIQTLESEVEKSCDKYILPDVPTNDTVFDNINSSQQNCDDVHENITKEERNKDFERGIHEKSGDEKDKFNLKTSLFYHSSDSEYESEEEMFDESHDDCVDGNEEKENEHLSECTKAPAVSGNTSDTSSSHKREYSNLLSDDIEAKHGAESRDVDSDLLLTFKIEKETNIEEVDDNKYCIETSNKKTDSESLIVDKTKNIEPGLEIKQEKVIIAGDENHADMYVDIDEADNLIDYQPDSQDIEMMKRESDSEDACCSDLEENSQEKNDPDFLPVIGKPRKMRYRQLKEESEQLYIQKKKNMDSEKKSNSETDITCKNEHEKCDLTADELYARQVQEDFDREAQQLEAQRALIDDAYIARQLHESLNKQTLSNFQDRLINNQQNVQYEQLINTSVNCNRGNESHVKTYVEKESLRKGSDRAHVEGSDKTVRGARIGNSEALVRELQSRELEKINRWKKMLLEDEKLAKSLQDIDKCNAKEEIDAPRTSQTQNNGIYSQNVEPSFKKMVAQHKASKEKAIAQLQEYRALQMRRFQVSHGGLPQNTVSTQHSYNNNSNSDDVIVLDEPTDFIIPKICGTPCRNTRPNIKCQESRTHFVSKTHGSGTEYQYSNYSATSQCDNSHVIKPSQSNSLSGSHMSTSNQSKYMYHENDQMTEVNQSQSSANKHSNVTCGNCGEKGHNRTFSRCPRYHTAEESARREAKLEKQRQQKEEKQKQEVETIHMLSEHRRVLEEMTSQIQREMGTIQNRLQQRATELESQVNSRVRKIENANKKKKK